MQSVRASRDHHLFDGYPGLIAVFRALQSLLMPSHPPCALCSLTTRIECSRTSPISDALLPDHRIAPCEKAEGSARHNDSRSFQEPCPANKPHDKTLEPWENASREPLETAPLRHSFKMPITTTKLSKNKTSRRSDAHIRVRHTVGP